MTAKTRAIPSLHRDSYSAKEPGLCPVRRQVTQTPFIAGPLWAIALATVTITLTNSSSMTTNNLLPSQQTAQLAYNGGLKNFNTITEKNS
jgi:hypothetical protein